MRHTEYTDKWVKALRTGKSEDGTTTYTQSQGTLHNSEGFCCLGVGADVVGCEWERHPGSPTMFVLPLDNMGGYRTGYLSEDYRDKLGIDYEDQQHLVSLNDNTHDADFVFIADVIEYGAQHEVSARDASAAVRDINNNASSPLGNDNDDE